MTRLPDWQLDPPDDPDPFETCPKCGSEDITNDGVCFYCGDVTDDFIEPDPYDDGPVIDRDCDYWNGL